MGNMEISGCVGGEGMKENEVEMIVKIKDLIKAHGYNLEYIGLTDVWTGHDCDYVMQLNLKANKRDDKK
jgi:hypothetical protein